MILGETKKKIDGFSRKCLTELLNECTEDQRKLFEKIYAKVENILEEKLESAIDLVERTIIKNIKFNRK